MLSSPNVPPCDTTHQPGKTSQGVRWHLQFVFFFKGTETNESLGMARLLIPRTMLNRTFGEENRGIGSERGSATSRSVTEPLRPRRENSLHPAPPQPPGSTAEHSQSRQHLPPLPPTEPRHQDSRLGRGRQFPHTC